MSAFIFFVLTAAIVLADPTKAQISFGSSKHSSVVYACPHTDLHLPWEYPLLPHKGRVYFYWYLNHRIFAHFDQQSDYFEALSSFRGRAAMTTNVGLVISNVTKRDAGIYTVIVQKFNPDGSSVDRNNSVTVQIIDELPKEFTELNVTQEDVAEYNDTTKQVHVVLACGKFVFTTKPHFDVEWLTPSGSVVPSTSYSDGQFRLQLPNPVPGGSYTCRVPASAAAASPCVPGTRQHGAEASVSVDRVEARLTLLEGQHGQLEQERLARQTQFQEYIDGQTRSIVFRVRMNGGFSERDSGTLITGFNQIQLSEGVVYERYSWKFITPLAGVYFFTLTTVSDGNGRRANADVMVDDVIACRIRSAMNGDFGSCEATVHLTIGQKVWLRSVDDHGTYGNGMYPTFAFSGFLVSKDV